MTLSQQLHKAYDNVKANDCLDTYRVLLSLQVEAIRTKYSNPEAYELSFDLDNRLRSLDIIA